MGDECSRTIIALAKTIISVIKRFDGNVPTAEQLQNAAEQAEANHPNDEGPLPDDLDYPEMVEDINWVIQKYRDWTEVETLAERLNELNAGELDETDKKADNAFMAKTLLDCP